MQRIAWYLDEDTMARALLRGLQARGIQVTTPLDVDLMGESDRTQLDFATSHDLTLYTFNVGDFCRLHREVLESGGHHSGLVVVPRQRYSIGEQVRGLAHLTATLSRDDMIDRLVFLKTPA